MKWVKKVIKKTIHNIHCSFMTIEWLVYKIFYENFRSYLKYDERNQRLVILANGPSLKKSLEQSDFSKSCDYCVVNFFANDPHFFSIKPNHYVLADPAFFREANSDSAHIELKNNLRKVDWCMNLYVPYRNYKQFERQVVNPTINLRPYHTIPYRGWRKVKNYLYRKCLTMPRPQNVLIPSIFIGISEGYEIIELYGVDHSWTFDIRVNAQNEVCAVQRHFYDKEELELKPWHIGVGRPIYKMHELLRALAWMFDGYHELEEYAKSQKCKVINKTPGSFIDAFERG